MHVHGDGMESAPTRMKVLILGGKGLLGGALAKAFLGHNVIVWDRAELDIADETSARKKIPELRPELIINCAAWNDVDGAEDHPDQAERLNGTAVGSLAAIARELGVTIIHYSTDYVFDGTNREGYDEDASPNPINAYGRSKALGERLLREATDEFYLIRTSRLYGPRPESPAAKISFVLRIAELARLKREVSSVDEESGAFTYVKDLAEATRRLVRDSAPYGIYHLTPSGQATWYQCAKEIVSSLGLATVVRPVPRSAYPVRRVIPPYTLLRSTKVPHLRDWKIALRDFLTTNPI